MKLQLFFDVGVISRFLIINFFSYETNVRTVNHSEPVITTSTSCSNSSESSPLASIRPKKENSKSVKFNPDVIDNELTSEKLIYAKLPMASPPKKPTVIIDIVKLNADQGFGFNNKYLITPDNAGSQDYNKDIFDSPYFDYRRTHSTVSTNHLYIYHKIRMSVASLVIVLVLGGPRNSSSGYLEST